MAILNNNDIFSKNLKYYMMLNNKDRYDICNALNIPYTTFSDWYNGKIVPRIDKIEKLANYFGINKSDLIENKYKATSVPLLGVVKAGYNMLAEENLLGYVDVDLKNPEEYFALRVKGDSMQPILFEDDIVIVHKQPDIENGQVAVVLIGDEATIKKVMKYDDYIELVAYNSYYPPKRMDEGFNIIGRVVEAKIKKIFE